MTTTTITIETGVIHIQCGAPNAVLKGKKMRGKVKVSGLAKLDGGIFGPDETETGFRGKE